MTDEQKGTLNAKIMGGLTLVGFIAVIYFFATSSGTKKSKSIKKTNN